MILFKSQHYVIACAKQASKQANGIMTTVVRSVGIVSIGEMGLGIARLLKAHDYKVATYAADRRSDHL